MVSNGSPTADNMSNMSNMSLNNTLIIHQNKASMDATHCPSVSPFFYGNRINNNINEANNNINNSNMINCNNNTINSMNSSNNLTDKTCKMQSIPQMQSLGLNHKLSAHINNILIRSKSPPNLRLSPTPTLSCESVPSSPVAFNRAMLQHFQLSSALAHDSHNSELQQPMLTNYLNSLSNHWKTSENSINDFSDYLKPGLHLPPPPEYERQWNTSSPNSLSTSASTSTTPESKSVERLSISRSHPDLSKLDDELAAKESMKCNDLMNCQEIRLQKYNMIEMLSAENAALKTELELYYKKVFKLQKVVISRFSTLPILIWFV